MKPQTDLDATIIPTQLRNRNQSPNTFRAATVRECPWTSGPPMVMKRIPDQCSKCSKRGADPQIRAGRLRPAQSEMPTRLERTFRPVTMSECSCWIALGSAIGGALQGVFNRADTNPKKKPKTMTMEKQQHRHRASNHEPRTAHNKPTPKDPASTHKAVDLTLDDANQNRGEIMLGKGDASLVRLTQPVIGWILIGTVAACAQGQRTSSKLSADLRIRLQTADTAPVFILFKHQPQAAILARTALESARAATLDRAVDPEAHAVTWRRNAHSAIARAIAPQQDRLETSLRARGATRFGRYTAINMITAEIPRWAIADLEADPEIESVFLAKTRQSHLASSVPSLGVPTWNANLSGSGQSIALVDTGVRADHPAFAGKTITNRVFLTFAQGSNCFDDDATPTDKQGHGTHIAGILMSQGSTGFSAYQGVAKGLATLYNLKAGYKSKSPCSTSAAEADDRDLVEAIEWVAVNTTSRITSLSFGGDVTQGDDDDSFALVIDQIADLYDVFIAISAGNSGSNANTVGSPAIGYNIVAVANWSSRGSIAGSSSRGPTWGGRFKPDIAAPGTSILSTAYNWDATNQADFVTKTGTSMAAPHIAGAAAALRQAGVTDPLQLKAILINSAESAPTWAADRGWGYIDLTAAQSIVANRDSRLVNAGGSQFYRFTGPVSLVSTLTWNRHVFGSTFVFNNLDLLPYVASNGNAVNPNSVANSTLQNVEKLAVQSGEDLVVKVRSAATDTAAEFYGIAFNIPFTKVNGPILTVTCTQPSSGTANAAIIGSCRVANTGALPAFNVRFDFTLGTGVSGVNSWTLGTIQPGADVLTNTSFISPTAGAIGFGATTQSNSYGDLIRGSASFTVSVAAAPSAPSVPGNLNIPDLALGIGLSGALSWGASSGAINYDIYFGAANPPPLFASNVTNLSVPYAGLTPGVTYYWQVVAKNAQGSTASLLQRFTTGASGGLLFVPIAPCRLVDTRNSNGPLAGPALAARISRTFALRPHACIAPAAPVAYSLNITVVPQGLLGFLTVWPAGQSQPVTSTLNALDGRIKANAAIVPAGSNGSIEFFATDATHVIIDINGYFVLPGTANGLAFYPVAPCRIADTRTTNPPALVANASRSFAVLSANCGVPSTARAYALNATLVPLTAGFGFLTLWPAGQSQPVVSTLNALTGTVTANAAIVPAGTNGEISVFGTDNAHLVLDINGYFAPAASVGALTFNTLTPCRVLDTRLANGPSGGPRLEANASRNVAITASPCQVPPTAEVYSVNATVVPSGPFGFLTMWPAGKPRPTVSTLNALDGAITSNAAIVSAPVAGGAISALGSNAVHLLLDISGYFAP